MVEYVLKINPLKCAFGVYTCDFLGFVVHKKGIEIKKKAIFNTKPLSNKKKLRSLLGKVNFLRRFISKLSGKTKVFLPLLLLKKEEGFRWEPEHQKAFEEIKTHLLNPPILSSPERNKPMKLYISASNSIISSMLA